MKYLFILLLATCVTPLIAQTTTTTSSKNTSVSVSEKSTGNSYIMTLKVDRGQLDELIKAFSDNTDTKITGDFRGTVSEDVYGDAEITLNAKKRTIVVSSTADNRKSKHTAEALAFRIRKSLGDIPATPATPK